MSTISISRYIGLRYLRARHTQRFVSVLSLISVIGIALGVIAIITVISVMNGFQDELRTRLLGVASHLVASRPTSVEIDWTSVAASLQNEDEVVSVSRYIESDVILIHAENVAPAILRGVVAGTPQAGLPDVSGDGVILGRELAAMLEVVPGETLSIVVPEVIAGGAGVVPRRREVRVAGLMQANVPQYDSALALLEIDRTTEFLKGIPVDSGVRIMLGDMDRVFDVMPRLQTKYPELEFQSWAQMHRTFFTALKIEKIVMFAILLMVIAVATFNIVATLAVTVSEKQADIAILKTLGASEATVRAIFLVQGSIMGLLGTGLGVLIGVPLAVFFPEVIAGIETLFGFKVFSPDMFYISEIPSRLLWIDVVRVAVFAFLITLLAAWHPARRAARVQPAQALRYE